jgi:Ca2+-binding EF-hand superfamily protein
LGLQPFFTERVFQIFDKDNSGTISLQEFIEAMHQFAGQSTDDKIRFLFKVYDLDGWFISWGSECVNLNTSWFQVMV